MRAPTFALTLIVLLASTLCLAQGKSAQSDMARKAWLAFYPAFKTAVKKRDRAALRRMMVSKAFDLESEEDSSPDAVFRYLDRTGNDGWPTLDKLVSRGTVTGRGNTRVIELKSIELGAPAGFIYRGGKWYWNIYMAGD